MAACPSLGALTPLAAGAGERLACSSHPGLWRVPARSPGLDCLVRASSPLLASMSCFSLSFSYFPQRVAENPVLGGPEESWPGPLCLPGGSKVISAFFSLMVAKVLSSRAVFSTTSEDLFSCQWWEKWKPVSVSLLELPSRAVVFSKIQNKSTCLFYAHPHFLERSVRSI